MCHCVTVPAKGPDPQVIRGKQAAKWSEAHDSNKSLHFRGQNKASEGQTFQQDLGGSQESLIWHKDTLLPTCPRPECWGLWGLGSQQRELHPGGASAPGRQHQPWARSVHPLPHLAIQV